MHLDNMDFHMVYFNPRSREGSDISTTFNYIILKKFQSSLPRGERHIFRLIVSSAAYFNPRSREGSDFEDALTASRELEISILAPARGATQIQRRMISHVGNFNPRSREGSDAVIITFWTRSTYFNPRSREGSDTSSTITAYPIINFNPRSREGSDAGKTVRCVFLQLFQSSLPRGERPILSNF